MAGKKNKIIPDDLFSPSSGRKKAAEPKNAGKAKASTRKASTSKPKASALKEKKNQIQPSDIFDKATSAKKPSRRKQAEQAVKTVRKVRQSVRASIKSRLEAAEPGSIKSQIKELDDGMISCPKCGKYIREDAAMCFACKTPRFICPYCKEFASGTLNQKLAMELQVNKVLKAYTLFTFALPSMPLVPIYNCTNCSKKVIICTTCEKGLKDTAEICLACRTKVQRTGLVFKPIELMTKITEYITAMKNANDMFMNAFIPPPPPPKKTEDNKDR